MPLPNQNPDLEDVSVLLSKTASDSVKEIAVKNGLTFEECLSAITENAVIQIKNSGAKTLADAFKSPLTLTETEFKDIFPD